jgi:hypothetical protein
MLEVCIHVGRIGQILVRGRGDAFLPLVRVRVSEEHSTINLIK